MNAKAAMKLMTSARAVELAAEVGGVAALPAGEPAV